MILVLSRQGDDLPGWGVTEFPDETIANALLHAENIHKKWGVVVQVLQGPMICKARWGPEDPGGIFNQSSIPPTYDKGEKESA